MSDSAEKEAKPCGELSSVTFAHPFADRGRSGSIFTIKDGDTGPRQGRTLLRSRSENLTLQVREQWGNELWSRGALKESITILRSSIAEYEKEASQQQWEDLLKINADVADLGKLADGARKRRSKKGDDDESVNGLSKFSAVALEYSKMLDVVMNQSPEYAGLAWGVRLHAGQRNRF